MNSRPALGIAIFVGAFGATSRTAGAADAAPPRFALGSLTTEPSTVHLTCDPLPALLGRRQIRCLIVRQRVELPDVARQEREIDAIPAHGSQIYPKMCNGLATGPNLVAQASVERERAFYVDVQQACAAKDEQKLIQAYVSFVREVDEHTCDMGMPSTETEDFTEVDASTWVWQSGQTAGECASNSTYTVWHAPGEPESFWNFRAVSVFSPNASGMCATYAGKTTVYDYSWRNQKLRDLSCRYFRL